MSKLVLQKIIKDCLQQTMTSRQIQFNLCKLANYLKNGEQVKIEPQINKNTNDVSSDEQITQKWKQYIDKEIQRVQEVFLRKLVQVQKIEIRIGGLCKEVDRINKTIEQQKGSLLEINQILIKNASENYKSFSNLKLELQNQILRINYEIKNLTDRIASNELIHPEKQAKQQNNDQQECPNIFSFDGKTLQKVGGKKNYFQYVFQPQIPFNKQFIFKIKIVKSLYNDIMIGVIDQEKHKKQKRSYQSKNVVCYYAFDGDTHPTGNKGTKLIQGQTVEVRVDRKNGRIRWMVKNKQIASNKHLILGQENRKLNPFVQIGNIGDIIEYSL